MPVPILSNTERYGAYLATTHPHDDVLDRTARNPAPARVAFNQRQHEWDETKHAFKYGLCAELFAGNSDAGCLEAVKHEIEHCYEHSRTFRRVINYHLAKLPQERIKLRRGTEYSTTVTERQIEQAGGRVMTLVLDENNALAPVLVQVNGECLKIGGGDALTHEMGHFATGLPDDNDAHNLRGAPVEFNNIFRAEVRQEKARAAYGCCDRLDDGEPEGVGRTPEKELQRLREVAKIMGTDIPEYELKLLETKIQAEQERQEMCEVKAYLGEINANFAAEKNAKSRASHEAAKENERSRDQQHAAAKRELKETECLASAVTHTLLPSLINDRPMPAIEAPAARHAMPTGSALLPRAALPAATTNATGGQALPSINERAMAAMSQPDASASNSQLSAPKQRSPLAQPTRETGAISKRLPPVFHPKIANPIRKRFSWVRPKPNSSVASSQLSPAADTITIGRCSQHKAPTVATMERSGAVSSRPSFVERQLSPVPASEAGAAIGAYPYAFSQPTSIVLPMTGIKKNLNGDYCVTLKGYSTPVRFDCTDHVWRTQGRKEPLAFGIDHPSKWKRITEEELRTRSQAGDHPVDTKTEIITLPPIKPIPADAKPIPKNIHYIWVGGEMPPDILENIICNTSNSYDAKAEAGYRSTIHVDCNDPKLFDALKKRANKVPGLSVENLRDTPFFEEFKKTDSYRQYSAAKDSDNHCYAAAADVLRYPLLNHAGGIYLDSDDTLLKSVANIDLNASGQDLLLSAFMPYGPREMEAGFNNGILGSHPNNALLKEISARSYAKFAQDPSFFDRPRPYIDKTGKVDEENEQRMDDYFHKISEMAGPGLLNEVLSENAKHLYDFTTFLDDEDRKTNFSLPSEYKQAMEQSFHHYFPFSGAFPTEPGNLNSWENS